MLEGLAPMVGPNPVDFSAQGCRRGPRAREQSLGQTERRQLLCNDLHETASAVTRRFATAADFGCSATLLKSTPYRYLTGARSQQRRLDYQANTSEGGSEERGRYTTHTPTTHYSPSLAESADLRNVMPHAMPSTVEFRRPTYSRPNAFRRPAPTSPRAHEPTRATTNSTRPPTIGPNVNW